MIYFVSILDGLTVAFRMLIVVGAAAGIMYVVAGATLRREDTEQKVRESWRFLRDISRIVFFIGLVALVLNVFIPSRKDLIQAYVLVESNKAFEAKDVKKALDDLDEKTSRLIWALSKYDDD